VVEELTKERVIEGVTYMETLKKGAMELIGKRIGEGLLDPDMVESAMGVEKLLATDRLLANRNIHYEDIDVAVDRLNLHEDEDFKNCIEDEEWESEGSDEEEHDHSHDDGDLEQNSDGEDF